MNLSIILVLVFCAYIIHSSHLYKKSLNKLYNSTIKATDCFGDSIKEVLDLLEFLDKECDKSEEIKSFVVKGQLNHVIKVLQENHQNLEDIKNDTIL